MSNAENLASLQKQRSSAKGNITRIKNMYQDGSASLNPIDVECRLEILNSYIKQLMAYQTEIEKLCPEDNKRGELEDVCISSKALLLSKLGNRRSSLGHDHTMSLPLPPANRLPHLKIPKFNGKYSEYKNFITCFNSLVHDDPTLSVIEKFNHLINSLQDDALRTVKAFQVNEENYSSALQRLSERYDNNCLIFQDHIATLFNIKKMNKPFASDLRNIVDTVSAVLDSLSHIGTDKDITNAMVIHLVLSKLDTDSKAKWDDQLNYRVLPKWSDCASVLIKRCQFLEINDDRYTKSEQFSKQFKPRTHNGDNHFKDKRNSSFSFTCIETKSEECSFCSGKDHLIGSCSLFLTLQVPQRFDFIKKKGLCINCLKIGHSVRKCRSSRCSLCQRPHHVLLHNEELVRKYDSAAINDNSSAQWSRGSNNAANNSPAQRNRMAATSHSGSAQCNQNHQNLVQFNNSRANVGNSQNATSMCTYGDDRQVILATALVQIKDKCGKYQLVRALLDSGSQINLISEEMAQRISIRRSETDINIVGIGNNRRKIRQSLSTYVKSCVNDFEFVAQFYVIKSITGKQPSEQIDKNSLGIPANVVLADPHFNKPQKIDILVGAESFFELLSVGQIKLGPSLPILQKTLLGWIVSGKCEIRSNPRSQLCQVIASNGGISLDLLNETVQRFWELEQVPMCSKLTDEQLLCQSHFERTTCRIEDGRFEVRLPFKTDPTILGSSYEMAKRRFIYLERKVSKNPDMKEMYVNFMKEYINLGHMSLADNINLSSPHYFIPHQCVIRAKSTTTKLRVVFDASSKTSTQISLNETLMVGPTIQEDLFSTLLRFRLNKFAITADITKMYRQVRVHKDDRKFQLILWRENPDLPIQTYELNTVTYGTAPAPFLAIRCLKEISDIFKKVYPVGSNVIATDFYVDDLLSGADDVETLKQIRREVTQILSSCGFNLAKWYSNCKDYNSDELVRHLELNDSDSTRALGITWKPEDDVLCFQLEDNFGNLSATKRNILSISSRLFDPLGLLAPIIIKAKILLQEIWENNLDWDESIPQNLDTTWQNFKKILSQIDSIVIPRFVGTTLGINIQIHGFADASMHAYGCCIYVRCNSKNGITTRLLVAKSKVAPSRKVKTLPRLELCAAHLLVKLWNVVKLKLSKFSIEKRTFWSDSEIVLHWVRTHPSALHTFVGNRVSEIQEKSSDVSWRYVPTAHNPADIVSRGCDVDEIKDSNWFSGPDFLKYNSEKWPKNTHFELSPESLALEKRKNNKTKVLLLSTELLAPALEKIKGKELENRILKITEDVSSHRKIIRIVAYIIRFLRGLRNKYRTAGKLGKIIEALSVRELDFSFLKIVEVIQNVEFKEEIRILSNSSLPKQNKIQKLNPFIQRYCADKINIVLLRVGGRLSKSSLPYDSKFPLLLKRSSRFVEKYFAELHRSNCHAGAKVLLGLSREKLWVVNARQLARKTVNNCILCFYFKPKLASQIMSDLPHDRITGCRPFWVCGVDLCGPVYTTLRIRGRPPVKTYVAVFVCFASKAVHLEALSDLQTDTFISTLNRFVGRRGLPKTIWCDNATNFVGTARLWADKDKIHLQQVTAEKGMEFRFIPPRAPHFGGLWEAAVKSAKSLLLRTVARANLTFEELTTVLVDVEAVLNSRPIVALTEDPNDEEALTPGHLLIGSSLKALPEVGGRGNTAGSLKRFRLLSSLKAHFWDVWQRDYVRDLQQRAKWTSPSDNVRIGEVVIVHEDNLPPQKWLIGRIVEVDAGADGKVRVAVIKTKNGFYKRPIHKLAPLPINSSQSDQCCQPCKGGGVTSIVEI